MRARLSSRSELIHTARKQTNQEIVFSLLKRELEEFKPLVYHNWNGQEMTNYQRQIPIFYGRFEIPSE